MIHAGDAAARRITHRKVNAHGIFELLVQLAALPRLGTPPMSGRQATPHHAAAKSLAHKQRVLGASQSTGSSSAPPRAGRQNARSQAASATQLPHPAGEAKRTGGVRHHRTLITTAAVSGCGANWLTLWHRPVWSPSARVVRREFIGQATLCRIDSSRRIAFHSFMADEVLPQRHYEHDARPSAGLSQRRVLRVVVVIPLLFARHIGQPSARSMCRPNWFRA
jgi:hypothetical protein